VAVDFDSLKDEEYFAHLKIMFTTEGWEVLCEELRDQARIISDIQDCKDGDDLQYKKGQLASIATLLNFEDTIKRAEEDSAPEVDE